MHLKNSLAEDKKVSEPLINGLLFRVPGQLGIHE
jgi:hypothetical protein